MPEPDERVRRGEPRVPFGVAEVHGPSMLPTLCHGDQLLVRYGARVRPGDVVILRHPFQQDLLVVKRAVERRTGGWWVRGDNPYAGGDSTDYGTVPEELVLARVLGRYRPRAARGGTAQRTPVASGDPGSPAASAVPAALPGALRSLASAVSWGLSSVRPVLGDAASRRLRAR